MYGADLTSELGGEVRPVRGGVGIRDGGMGHYCRVGPGLSFNGLGC